MGLVNSYSPLYDRLTTYCDSISFILDLGINLRHRWFVQNHVTLTHHFILISLNIDFYIFCVLILNNNYNDYLHDRLLHCSLASTMSWQSLSFKLICVQSKCATFYNGEINVYVGGYSRHYMNQHEPTISCISPILKADMPLDMPLGTFYQFFYGLLLSSNLDWFLVYE